MGKFVKGLILGAAIGVAAEMILFPQMDRKTQRSIRRAGDKFRDFAGNTYDDMCDWIK